MSFFKRTKPLKMMKETITMIFPTLKENKDYIYNALFDTGDLKTKEITWNDKSGIIMYLETMVDMEYFEKVYFPALTKTNEGQQLEDLTVSPDVMKVNQLNKVVDRKSTRLNSSHVAISYAVFCLKQQERGSIGAGRCKV